MDPSIRVKLGLGISCSMLDLFPVDKLSRTTTSSPCAIRASERCEPMNPAPPVIKYFTQKPPRVLSIGVSVSNSRFVWL